MSDAEILRLREALPPTTLLVIDAAYAEFVRERVTRLVLNWRESAMMSSSPGPSKIHGLAAVRWVGPMAINP